ncbi:unnamed protein product (macronuclear) [Paramecium tetraurelia]|uniref:Uncharacterized protein n=1 Tax=Paramecium tetraurelia TaxID=5888 RepID=A0C5N8_PARTE|nr:uncharacterized protein GSPATT00035234001 [Paramecium tetraurelia]CAK66105.1 unnamed protein product [Paramecium tetraurelia]|eukprot:XP_001433502.1 hypothetical protein (macronuclear) [Paramecium tetraurelia strain d4-2]
MNGNKLKSRKNKIISQIIQQEARLNRSCNNRLPSIYQSARAQKIQVQISQPYKQFRLTRYKNESIPFGTQLLDIKKKQLTSTTLHTLEESL